MRTEQEIEQDAERNRRALLEVGSVALGLLLSRRNEAITAGLRSGRSLPGIAGLIQSRVADGIVNGRVTSRAAGLFRLDSEARGAGVFLAGPRQMADEIARDIARARLYANNYAQHWLEKATGSGLKPGAAADVANKVTLPRITTTGITESSEAFNTGRAKYLRAAPDSRLLKVWDAQLDACPKCRELDGTIVFANERFPGGTPGAMHARCKCVDSIIGVSELVAINRAA